MMNINPAKPFHDPSVNATLEAMNSGPTEVHSLEVSNIDAADYFLQLFDATATTDVTLGTTVPVLSYHIPSQIAAAKRGVMAKEFASPIGFAKGVVYAITTTVGGLTGPTTPCVLNATYRDVRAGS